MYNIYSYVQMHWNPLDICTTVLHRSLGAEILYLLATGSKNIGDSLTRFGVGDDDRDLLAVVVVEGAIGDEAADRAEDELRKKVKGRLAPMEELEQVRER